MKHRWLIILLSIIIPALLIGIVLITSGLVKWGGYIIIIAGYISVMFMGYYNLYKEYKQKEKSKRDTIFILIGIMCSIALLALISTWYWNTF